jgi:hypothetical protein
MLKRRERTAELVGFSQKKHVVQGVILCEVHFFTHTPTWRGKVKISERPCHPPPPHPPWSKVEANANANRLSKLSKLSEQSCDFFIS